MSVVAPLVNGISPTPGLSLNEAAEYETLLKLRDEVFQGLHPRLSVPAHAIRNVSTLTPQLTAQANLAVPSSSQQSIREIQPSPTTAITTGASVPPASEFNPVLLTKSDDLVRAETVLKRQRLEKALKEQFEQKRLDARKKPAPAEAKPDFDIPALVSKAVAASKPAISPKDEAEDNDSFDENSFYSSRAPDSTPERGARSPSQEAEDGLTTDAPSGAHVQSAVMGAPLDADADDEYSPRLARRESPAYSPTMDQDDEEEEEEGEYSPPEAVEQDTAMQEAGYSNVHDAQDPRSRPLRRYSEVDDGTRGSNMRIVRNHITSPIAPQPSRVSPLAVAKQPPLQQNTRGRRNKSPDAQHTKKKRKLDKRERKARRNGQSPGVKEESPPPFHEVQPLGSGRFRPTNIDQPILIDDAPREVRYMPAARPVDSPGRSAIRYAEPALPMSEPRAGSRAGMRPMRDTQDLRRVASMHNVRAEMGDEFDAYGTPTRARVTSYRESSPIVRQQVLDDPYERQPLQEVRVSRTPAPIYRDTYGQETYVRYEPMPPPPVERIVVDEYGNKFREIIEQRPSADPRSGSVRPAEAGPEYDAYRAVRAGSIFVDAPQDRRYAQPDMPPPPPIYRQDAPRASASQVPREAYSQPVARSASVIIDRAPRPPVYVDDRGEFREPVRMGSARPEARPYEEMQPRGMAARASSVRPGAREGTMLVDQPRREYLPVEQPRYRMVEHPSGRYFDEQGREIITQRY
ncbi:uncharacterized protein HMPREF1541_01663 [Cyphellophora europaea CBS 101466]|uniref:Uncharacterized protein n=1 Tax=Cyphellophora europaea (strain CBS 101466) TaxID=1220924 RepID=W2S1B5_CYPE1|nr:uncharacterized protein HMPREF1541_01663 [Cyphellophora europaea CBS 101466]ETN42506.1 hypothetical protein HMPREF1541_01663 [Cyphellophora europaea CBS 101466]